jgi:hypothetical protein
VREWATEGEGDSETVNMTKYGRAFLWRDDDEPAENLTAYRFIVADVYDGTLKYVPQGIFTAANVLSGGRGGTTISEEGQAKLRKSVEQLYARMRSEFNDEDIIAPWLRDD